MRRRRRKPHSSSSRSFGDRRILRDLDGDSSFIEKTARSRRLAVRMPRAVKLPEWQRKRSEICDPNEIPISPVLAEPVGGGRQAMHNSEQTADL